MNRIIKLYIHYLLCYKVNYKVTHYCKLGINLHSAFLLHSNNKNLEFGFHKSSLSN